MGGVVRVGLAQERIVCVGSCVPFSTKLIWCNILGWQMCKGDNCHVVFITVASIQFSSILIVVSNRSMVRQYYDPNKNTKPLKHTSSIVFIGHAFFYYDKRASKLSSLTLAHITFYYIGYLIQSK